MTFQQRFMIITVLAAVTAAIVLARKPVPTPSSARVMSQFRGLVAAWLAVVAGALLVVGIVSDTLLRHIIQIAPLVVALSLLPRRFDWGVSAAAPLFAFWLFVMGAIWLFLLGGCGMMSDSSVFVMFIPFITIRVAAMA